MISKGLKVMGSLVLMIGLFFGQPSETYASGGTVTVGECQIRAYTTSPRGTMVFYTNCPTAWFPAEQ